MKASYSVQLNNRLAFAVPSYGVKGMLRLAEMADDSPFNAVMVGDSLFDSPRFEPIAMLGAVAARTRRVKLGAAIIQPHFRHPAMLALSWATLDIASEGRTVLALGIGGGTPHGVGAECREVGITPSERGKILERCVGELRAIWSGTHPRINQPVRPIQKLPPIWIAAGIYQPGADEFSAQSGNIPGEGQGYLPGPLDRVARLADGWLTIMATPDELRRSLAVLRKAVASHGRKPEALTAATDIWINVGPDPKFCFERIRSAMSLYFNGDPVSDGTLNRWSVYGPPEMCREKLAALEAAGMDHIELVIGEMEPFKQFELVVNQVLS
jgi:alkanesulfonate monooxygenase SsuD/methylene tetrahydromethanopterin reductase-like flavin-dependent oxidoreductase (luciferase family)